MAQITRGRACAIIRQGDRILLNRYGGDSFWALPGGVIEAGEFSPDGLRREMMEELGVAVDVGRLAWVIENLFEYRDKQFTEYGFHYEAAWPAQAAIAAGEFQGRQADQFFRWVSATEVPALDFRPSGLKPPVLALMGGIESAALQHFRFSGK